MRTLDEGIEEAKERGDLQMVRWLSDLKFYVGVEDMTKPQPCWAYVNSNDIWAQLAHVREEVAEVGVALLEGDHGHAAEEVTDVITACTTLLEIMGYNEERRAVLQARVNEKNRRRGYWNND